MTVILTADTSEPLYRQVRHAIEDALKSGQFRNHPLPSSRALAAELGVSRTTVNLAYQELVAEGYIVAEPRIGFRVNLELLSHLERQASDDHDHVTGHTGPSAGANARSRVDWSAQLHDRSSHRLPEIRKDYDWTRYPYPFIYGQVPASAFPVAAWNRALSEAMHQPHISFSLRDAGSDDDPMLVEELCTSVLPSRGIRARPDQVLITAGAQHGLFLATQAVLRSGDVAVVEDPGYPDTAHILERAGANLEAVPVDHHGLRVADLPKEARIVAVTPSHQFPTNVSLGVARRAQLLEYADRHDSFILEDDYDSEFRYIGQPVPALRASGHPRVVYAGSFSKFLAPGLRLGYVVAEAPLIEQMRSDRRYSVRHLPGQVQRALAIMIASGDYHRAIRRQRSVLRDKWKAMTVSLRNELGPDFEAPTGGISMWVRLPDSVDADRVAALAVRRGILVEAGSTFYVVERDGARSHLRLAYAAIPADRIPAGISALFAIVHGLA